MSGSKIIRKKQIVRSIIFRGEISRRELLKLSGLNDRTVVRYANELKLQGLIQETYDNSKRGHPTVVYRSNSEKIFFAGITASENWCSAVALNINGHPLSQIHFIINKKNSVSELLTIIFEHLDRMIQSLPGMTLYAIGCGVLGENWAGNAQIRTFLPPNAMKRYSVPVELHDSDELLLQHYAESHMLQGRIGAFFLDQEFRIVLLENGEISEEYKSYLQQLRHFQLAPDLKRKCYCGKCGCLNQLLSASGIVKAYSAVKKEKDVMSEALMINTLFLGAASGGKPELEIMAKLGTQLGFVAEKMRSELRLDYLLFMHTKPVLAERVQRAYAQYSPPGTPPLFVCNFHLYDHIFLPALLMRRRLLEFENFSMES